METIDLTPKWSEILPTWRFMVEQVTTRDKADPENGKDPNTVMMNFWAEMKVMAEAADKWNSFGAPLVRRCLEEGFDWEILEPFREAFEKELNQKADEDEYQREIEEARCERCGGTGVVTEPVGIAGEAIDADFVERPCPECNE
jgi:hypothetical protein